MLSHKLFFRSPKPFVPDLEVAIRPDYNHLIVDIGVLAQSGSAVAGSPRQAGCRARCM